MCVLFFQAEDGIRDLVRSRGLGDVYKRQGVNYTLQSPRLKIIMLRVFLFFLQATGLMALLPLVARGLHGGGAGTFPVMLSCVGVGLSLIHI